MGKIDLQSLEIQIDKLVQACQHLAEENQALQTQQVSLITERDTLLEKNALARDRIEAMIARLKAMDVGVIANEQR
ncbi:MAG: TIGR02449 family protein [Beggiatoa sp. IS2]|nr:MAG: TIGR02449 family protein [Beggiatoa sp. IS2]